MSKKCRSSKRWLLFLSGEIKTYPKNAFLFNFNFSHFLIFYVSSSSVTFSDLVQNWRSCFGISNTSKNSNFIQIGPPPLFWHHPKVSKIVKNCHFQTANQLTQFIFKFKIVFSVCCSTEILLLYFNMERIFLTEL